METPPSYHNQSQSISTEQFEIYKSYAMWNAYHQHQNQLGYYSSVPAYQQLAYIVTSSLPSPSSDTTLDSNSTSPTSMRDFKLTCEHCGSVYTSRKRLQNHYEKCIVLNPHLDEVIVCKICKRTFRTNPGYANHMTKFHGETIKENEEVKRIRKRARSEDDIEQVKQEMRQDVRHQKRSIFHSIELLAQSDSQS